MRQGLMRTAFLLGSFWLIQGTATQGNPGQGIAPARVYGTGKIFVANGSGDSTAVSDSLREVRLNCRECLTMETLRWSKGLGTIDDHSDIVHQRRWGEFLACKVLGQRKSCPQTKIYLLGQSAGVHVVLAAAEALPPNTVDRIILLASSVSCTYDLRPALRASREGIDHYFSQYDGVLDLAVDYLGTADGTKLPAAGQVGFKMPMPPFPDHHLYRKLRQFPWNTNVEWTGHHGGHEGASRPTFLQYYVLPIMLAPPPF